MRCERYARWLALDVEGDLPPRRAARLAAHVDGCALCRRTAEELRASQRALRALAGAPPADSELGAVRAAVMARLAPAGRRRPPGAAPAWLVPALATSAATVVVAVAGWLWLSRSPAARPSARPPVVASPERLAGAQPPSGQAEPIGSEAPPPTESLAVAPVAAPPPSAGLAAVAPAPPIPEVPSEPMVIKLLSDNQDIVIYWLVEPKEKAHEAVEAVSSA